MAYIRGGLGLKTGPDIREGTFVKCRPIRPIIHYNLAVTMHRATGHCSKALMASQPVAYNYN